MKRRVIYSFMTVILLMLILIESILFVSVRQYYYQSMANTLQSHAETSSSFFNKYEDNQLRNYQNYSDEIIRSFNYEDTTLALINRQGEVLFSSTGFQVNKNEEIPTPVLEGEETYVVAENEVGERVLASYNPLQYNGQTIAALKYTTSLQKVDETIQKVMLLAISIGIALSLIVFFISLKLANSIVTPIKEITTGAAGMADRHFQKRLDESYPHELGELSRTLNYMADEIQKTDQLKNDFISSISHELRTPLTGIKGWSETMRDNETLTKEEVSQGMGMISSETERLIHLVEELLDFSRFQSNRIQLNKKLVSISRVAREVTMQMGSKAAQRDIYFREYMDPEIEMMADEYRLKQVFFNVVDNAIKYSVDSSDITIQLKKQKNQVTFVVRDSGIGIAEEDLPYIKETFYQSDFNQPGSGLGLALSNEIVELHGGELIITSEPGKGTEVTVVLPGS